eukprot:scaffold208_cov323-Pavlova_lutheri.AAC.4
MDGDEEEEGTGLVRRKSPRAHAPPSGSVVLPLTFSFSLFEGRSSGREIWGWTHSSPDRSTLVEDRVQGWMGWRWKIQSQGVSGGRCIDRWKQTE